MRGFRPIFDEIIRIASAILTVAAVLSLMFTVASFFASRRPLAAEVDVFSLHGVRMASQVGLRFQGKLFDATRTLDPKVRDSLIAEWARVGNLLQANTSLLVLRITNRGSRPLTNLAITIDFVSQFRDIAIDTNARAILEALSNAPLATYHPSVQRLEIQTFPRLPARTQVTISVWGDFDLAPQLGATIVADEIGTVRPNPAIRVTGFRARVLENAHWLTVALGLFVLYEALSLVDRVRIRRNDSTPA